MVKVGDAEDSYPRSCGGRFGFETPRSRAVLLTYFINVGVFAICAHSYAGARALIQTIGVHLNAALFGALISFVYLVLFAGVFFTLYYLLRLLRRGRKWSAPKLHWRALLLSALLGWATAEIWVTADEVRFLSEVARNTEERYTRGRSWPNVGTQLVYIPGRGVHATD